MRHVIRGNTKGKHRSHQQEHSHDLLPFLPKVWQNKEVGDSEVLKGFGMNVRRGRGRDGNERGDWAGPLNQSMVWIGQLSWRESTFYSFAIYTLNDRNMTYSMMTCSYRCYMCSVSPLPAVHVHSIWTNAQCECATTDNHILHKIVLTNNRYILPRHQQTILMESTPSSCCCKQIKTNRYTTWPPQGLRVEVEWKDSSES